MRIVNLVKWAMVKSKVDFSAQETAVPETTSIFLITQAETVQQHITQILAEIHPTWGRFSLHVYPSLPTEEAGWPHVFVLDAALLDALVGDTAVFLKNHPSIIVTHALEYRPTGSGTEVYNLHDLNESNLPHIIKKSMQQVQLLQKEERQRVLTEALRDTSASLTISWDLDEVLDHILAQIRRVVPYDKVNIMLVDEDQTTVLRFWGYDNYAAQVKEARYLLAQIPTLQEMVLTKKPLLIPDVSAYEKWVESIPTTRSWLAAPILIDEDVRGFLCLDKKEAGFYQQEHLDQLPFFADQVALAMEKAHLYATKQRHLDELSVLHQLALIGVEASSEDDLIEQATKIIGDSLYPDNFGILLLDEKGENLLTHPSYKVREGPFIHMHIPVSQGIVGYVVRTQRPYISGDITHDEYYLRGADKTQSEICIPFFLGDQLGGVINAESMHKDAFSKSDVQLITTLANQLGVGIERMRLFAQERQRRKEAEILREAAMTLNATLDVDTLLIKLLDFLSELVAFDSAAVVLPDENGRLYIKALRGYAERHGQTLLAHTFEVTEYDTFQRVFQTQNIYLLEDTTLSPEWKILPEAAHVRSWLGIPLVVGGRVLGCYALDKVVPSGFTERDIELGKALASQTAVSLQNVQLIQQSKKAVTESSIVNGISQALNATPDVAEVFPQLYRALKKLTGCSVLSLFLLTQKREQGVLLLLEDEHNPNRPKREIIEITQASAAVDVLAGIVHQTPDLSLETQGYPVTKRFYEMGIRSRINIPLISGSSVIGSLNLGWGRTNGYEVQQIPLLSQIANAIALALERSRLFEEIKQWAQHLTVLHEFGRKVTEEVEIETLCNTAVSYLTQNFSYPGVSVFLTDEKKRELVLYAIEGAHKDRTPPHVYRQKFGEGIIGQAALQKSRIHTGSTGSHPFFKPSPRLHVQSEIALPLYSGNTLYGVLDVNSDQPDAFSEDDLAILTIVADQLAISLSKAQLFAQTKQHAFELEALLELSSTLRIAKTVDEMIPAILQQTLKMAGGSLCSLYLIDEASGDLVERGHYPFNPILTGRRNKMGEGLTGHVAQTGEIYVLHDAAADPIVKMTAEESIGLQVVRSSVNLPLKTQHQVVGVMHVGFGEQAGILDEVIPLLTAVSEIAGTAIERALMLQTLEARVAERTSELADANERLKELDRLKSKFVADVSHELRTPIANLMLYLDLIEQGDPQRLERYLSVLHQQAQRLTHLIEDTLNLSVIELGKDKISFHAFDLNQVVEAVSTAHLPSVEAANLALSIDLEPDLPHLYGERNQLAQVIANLLANAINYTPEGEIRISTSWHRDDNELWLIVSDSGMGIAPEDMTHLYDRFYRGKSVSQSTIPGTGLGLAIVKEIVDLHAGKIIVESTEDVGTTFTVKFPVYSGLT